jgi:actin-related protein
LTLIVNIIIGRIELGTERFEVVEAIFRPALVEKELIGITELVINQMKWTKEKSPNRFEPLCKTVLLSGKFSTLRGIKERFVKDITSVFGGEFAKKFKVITSSLNPVLPTIGGAIIANSENFTDICLTKEEFEQVEHNHKEFQKILDVWENAV